MNTMKKIATLLLAVCLVVPCFSMLTHAASGKVMFEDPTTAVGETLTLKGVIEAGAGIEDRKVMMSYDTSKLKFKNGDNVTENPAGKLTYELKGTKSGTRVEFLMHFDVLQEGTASVKADSAEAWTTTNEKVTWTSLGSSKITINAGQATTEPDDTLEEGPTVIVDVDGVSYTFSDAIPDSEIPDGFTASLLEYAGSQHKVVTQESTGVTLAYLLDANKEGKLFMYVEENATFAPFEQITISKTTVITILSYVENVTLPEAYELTTVPINGVEFPAWQNSEQPSFCILYALNATGEKTFYQYDSEEATYQRFEVPTEKEEEEQVDTTLIGKLNETMGEHLDTVIIGVGVALILFILIIIVLSVKLYNRNAELDEIYDEYGIGLDEDEEEDEVLVRIKYDEDEEEDDRFVILDEEEDEEEDEEDGDEEVPAVSKTEEVEDDIFFEEASEPEVKENTELELDLFADEEEDEKEDEEDGFVDDDLDFEISFLDLDD